MFGSNFGGVVLLLAREINFGFLMLCRFLNHLRLLGGSRRSLLGLIGFHLSDVGFLQNACGLRLEKFGLFKIGQSGPLLKFKGLCFGLS